MFAFTHQYISDMSRRQVQRKLEISRMREQMEQELAILRWQLIDKLLEKDGPIVLTLTPRK